MPPAVTIAPNRALNELNSGKIHAYLADEDDLPLGPANLETLTGTLYDIATADPLIPASGIINGFDHLDLLNVGRGTIDVLGHLVVRLHSDDNPIVTAGNTTERHKLLIIATWNSGEGQTSQEIIFTVTNVTKVPT